MRDERSCVLPGSFSISQLLPDPHPALWAAFPGGEGVWCIRLCRAASPFGGGFFLLVMGKITKTAAVKST